MRILGLGHFMLVLRLVVTHFELLLITSAVLLQLESALQRGKQFKALSFSQVILLSNKILIIIR